MSADPRYYYVDAQNQASGPIAMAGLLALKAAGTVTDATLVVLEGGTEWVAFSTLKAEGAGALHSSAPVGVRSDGGPSSSAPAAEPLWSSQLSQKIDQLTAAMDRLVMAMEKARPSAAAAPVIAPATAALHAEKINLNPTPKTGIASLNPATAVPGATPRPGVNITLSPLAVPANAQKSVYFESPHRITRALAEAAEVLPAEARIAVCRELTKKFEEVFVGTPAEAAAKFGENTKGEITLVISPLG